MKTLTRRQFLRGAQGATLLLPFLPSLLASGEAVAGTPTRKRFVALRTDHGSIWGKNMFPSDAALTDSKTYAERTVRRGNLVATQTGNNAVVSPVLTASSSVLTPSLLAKLTVIRGLDITFRISHHSGGHLGNYSANTGSEQDAVTVQKWPTRTIDQVMAWSPSFYPDTSGMRVRDIVLGSGMSWNYSNPSTKTGALQDTLDWGMIYTVKNTFDAVFGTVSSGGPPPRPLIVDRVLQDYQRLRNGNRRLSAADKSRLDDHIERVYELQRKLGAQVTCGDVSAPADNVGPLDRNPANQAAELDLYLDVVATAFGCQASSIAVASGDPQSMDFSTYAGDWHTDIAHNMDVAGPQQTFVDSYQFFFENVFLHLAAKLDQIDDGNGQTVLDNTLISWSSEHGDEIHGSYSIPVVTAGGAGGFLRTGSYIDYRNPNISVAPAICPGADPSYAGLRWGQYLATMLLAMGVPASEWEEPGGGYGTRFLGIEATAGNWYPTAVQQNNSSPLPYWTPNS